MSFTRWFRNRYVWVAVTLLATTAGVAVLLNSGGSAAGPVDLGSQIENRMRTTLEQSDPGQHNHGSHGVPEAAGGAETPVICGVRVYGYEPARAKTLAEVRDVYGFHLCGVAEPKRPWDVAVKLAGPVIVDLATDPPGITAVEATPEVKFVDRLRQMFPEKYAQLALTEALADEEMADLRRRYDDAARA